MNAQPAASIQAIVTDPPYGLREFTDDEKAKLRAGRGGVWRQPPTIGGVRRSPLPRFTVLSPHDRIELLHFFRRFARATWEILVPGAHVFVASNPLLSHIPCGALLDVGFENRGQIMRLVQTLRGGDRPKGAEAEFPDVTVMPRSQWEPWLVFRKPCEGTVAENLRKYGTGALRRKSVAEPFGDAIKSAPTHARERGIAPHPSLKPQAFVRQVVRAALPLGAGVVLDPFMGGGSIVAAAEAVGYRSVGVERDREFFEVAQNAIPSLAALTT
jgi:hypothetical protein